MTEKSLQEEFQVLITEISKEVMDLSVSKSMEQAAYAVKEQVPVLSRNIDTLQNVLDNLRMINEENIKHQEETKVRETGIHSKLESIEKIVESDYQSVLNMESELSNFKDTAIKKLTSNKGDLENLKHMAVNHSSNLRDQVTELRHVTNGGVETGNKVKTLLIWTLFFAFGSFGILTTLLLHTLKLISL